MVRLPLGLSLVRRFDLSGQAKYLSILFEGTCKTKQTTTKQQHKYTKREEEKKKRKKEKKKKKKKKKKKDDHI